jgi:gliding motility-associated-like protein
VKGIYKYSCILVLICCIGLPAKSQNAVFTYRVSQISSFLVSFQSQYAEADTLVYNFLWDFGDGTSSILPNPEHMFTAADSFIVTLLVDDGIGSDSYSETVYLDDLFEVPNVFTPNGDGVNDFFILRSNGLSRLDITIFNRWGTLVFSASSTTIIWDGKTPDGSPIHPGTYFYTLLISENGTQIKKKGTIRIFR